MSEGTTVTFQSGEICSIYILLLFLSKISSLFFQGIVPNEQHFFGEFRYCTLGATGVCHSDPSRSIFKIFPSSDERFRSADVRTCI